MSLRQGRRILKVEEWKEQADINISKLATTVLTQHKQIKELQEAIIMLHDKVGPKKRGRPKKVQANQRKNSVDVSRDPRDPAGNHITASRAARVYTYMARYHI